LAKRLIKFAVARFQDVGGWGNRLSQHFAPIPNIAAEASPQEYARLMALAFIRRAPVPAIRNESREQPTLFSLLDR
jgi:hypothetical protein